jgi:hypothetical protein
MLDTAKEWHLSWCDAACKTEIYYLDGDTLEGGKSYKVLNGFHYISRSFWLREDISSRKVWISLEINRKRQEFLLYDFSLGLGDTIRMRNPISPFPQDGGLFVVDSIVATLQLDGLAHRFFYFSPSLANSSTQKPVWMEGMGSLSLINAPGGTPNLFKQGQVSCFYSLQQQIYEDLDTSEICQLRYLSLAKARSAPSIQLRNNLIPRNTALSLLGLGLGTYSYRIMDYSGHILSKGSFSVSETGETKIPLRLLSLGYYHIWLESSSIENGNVSLSFYCR